MRARREGLLEVLIRAALIFGLAALCYRIFAPFLTLTAWAVILAVSLYPMHQALAARIGGRQGLAATLVVVLGIAIIIVPTAVLMGSLGESVHRLVANVQEDKLEIPAPPDSVASWPLVGDKVHATWTKAHDDLPGLVKSMQPKVGNLAKAMLGFVASIGGGILQFLAAFVVAGIIMAYGDAGARASLAIFQRVAGEERGTGFTKLATATIRAVSQGVIGVAFIQAVAVGLCLLFAGVPWAGALSLVVLVIAIAQLPALIVTLPAIAYIWWQGDNGTFMAVVYTVLLVLTGAIDNVLKPLMLGRGVEAPMPVILLGALGGMAGAGILGMFVGATALALGYLVFTGWVSAKAPPADTPRPSSPPPREPSEATATVPSTGPG